MPVMRLCIYRLINAIVFLIQILVECNVNIKTYSVFFDDLGPIICVQWTVDGTQCEANKETSCFILGYRQWCGIIHYY